MQLAKLALEDGTVYTGRAFGETGERVGEVVFNTSLTGYQEILTDPSYKGQIVTMTYPLIGNYGTTADDAESMAVQVQGFVVRELTRVPSNYRSHRDLDTYLKANHVTGIEGIDTRSLVRRLRTRGAMGGCLSSVDLDNASLVAKAINVGSMAGKDMVKEVVPEKAFTWSQGFDQLSKHVILERPATKKVVAIDYGMKWNILRCLRQIGCHVTVVPGTCTAEEVLAHEPDGIFLSNGPGDPSTLDYAVDTVKGLLGKKPVFGICLGHQLLGRAFGSDTFKLKFGHRGANQPVLNKQTGVVEITTQNHGFAVNPETLPPDVVMTHVNLNDGTCEGLRSTRLPAFSVQYHPEAAAGPHDSTYLFEQFYQML
jgi:carbamoyl-phosphate synthase small subunit